MNYLLLAAKFFPYILQGVVAVENSVNAPGATKKQIVLDSLMTVAQIGGTVPEAHVSAISKMIDAVVRNMNSAGIFDKSTAAVAATAGK